MTIPREEVFPIDLQVMWSEIKVKLLIFILSVIYSISYDSLYDGYENVPHWLTIEKRFWVTKSRHLSIDNDCPLWTICLNFTILGTVVATRVWIIHCIYVTLSNVYQANIHFSQTFLVKTHMHYSTIISIIYLQIVNISHLRSTLPPDQNFISITTVSKSKSSDKSLYFLNTQMTVEVGKPLVDRKLFEYRG